ncbi:hypothetical protein KA005_13710 [bacterium]|nr:hypothetical protein [bacterium]
MKKFLLTVLLLAFASTSFALEPYAGIHGGAINYDKTLYSIDTAPNGASIGVTQDLGDTPFFVRLELFTTEHAASPTAGFGMNLGAFKVSAGLSADNEERAYHAFSGNYSLAQSTDEFTSKFIDVEGYNFFARYSEYDVTHNFVGANTVNPQLPPAKFSVTTDNSVIQVGYRYKF